jgi:hypothetical protein
MMGHLRAFCLLGLLLSGVLITACAPTSEQLASQTTTAQTATAALWTNTPTATSTSTPTRTPTPTSSPTSTPTSLPIQAHGWETATLHALCLDVTQTFTNMEGDFSLPIDETISRLVGRIGIQTTQPGSMCDATLTLDVTAQPLSANYGEMGRCYSGASVTSQAILSSEGFPDLKTAPYSVTETPFFLILSNNCATEPTGAPFGFTSSGALLGTLLQIWGQPALLTGLADADREVQLGVVYAVKEPEARTAGLGTDDIVSILTLAFQGDNQDPYCWVSGNASIALGELGAAAKSAIPVLEEAALSSTCKNGDAILALEHFGPAAREAVPTLIQVMKSGDDYLAEISADALKAITGQNFGQDAEAWQEWWDSQG